MPGAILWHNSEAPRKKTSECSNLALLHPIALDARAPFRAQQWHANSALCALHSLQLSSPDACARGHELAGVQPRALASLVQHQPWSAVPVVLSSFAVPVHARMAYTVRMSNEDAQLRLQSGAVCLLLDAPEQLAFGINHQARPCLQSRVPVYTPACRTHGAQVKRNGKFAAMQLNTGERALPRFLAQQSICRHPAPHAHMHSVDNSAQMPPESCVYIELLRHA